MTFPASHVTECQRVCKIENLKIWVNTSGLLMGGMNIRQNYLFAVNTRVRIRVMKRESLFHPMFFFSSSSSCSSFHGSKSGLLPTPQTHSLGGNWVDKVVKWLASPCGYHLPIGCPAASASGCRACRVRTRLSARPQRSYHGNPNIMGVFHLWKWSEYSHQRINPINIYI